MTEQIPEDGWEYIVENVPIPSVDLVVRDPAAGAFLLGKRTSDVAHGTWFVPGGRIHKNERYSAAVERVLHEETGLDGRLEDRLGSYEHFYETADAAAVESKHYTPTAFVIEADSRQPLRPDAQHSELRWFREPPATVHEYARTYLEDAGLVEEGG